MVTHLNIFAKERRNHSVRGREKRLFGGVFIYLSSLDDLVVKGRNRYCKLVDWDGCGIGFD